MSNSNLIMMAAQITRINKIEIKERISKKQLKAKIKERLTTETPSTVIYHIVTIPAMMEMRSAATMITKMKNEKMNGNVEGNIWKLIRQRSMGEERGLKGPIPHILSYKRDLKNSLLWINRIISTSDGRNINYLETRRY